MQIHGNGTNLLSSGLRISFLVDMIDTASCDSGDGMNCKAWCNEQTCRRSIESLASTRITGRLVRLGYSRLTQQHQLVSLVVH